MKDDKKKKENKTDPLENEVPLDPANKNKPLDSNEDTGDPYNIDPGNVRIPRADQEKPKERKPPKPKK